MLNVVVCRIYAGVIFPFAVGCVVLKLSFCLFVFTAFQRVILQNFEQLKEMIRDQQASQNVLAAKVEDLLRFTGVTSGTTELPSDVKFPLKTLAELDVFEQQMEDSQFKHLVVSSACLLHAQYNRKCIVHYLLRILHLAFSFDSIQTC